MTMSSTNPTGCGSITTQLCDFTTNDAGKPSGTAYGTLPCNPPSQVRINGTTDLSDIIVGASNACVQTFVYQAFDGIARNSEVYVYGQGPEGIGSGSLCLTFLTANGSHDLSLSSSHASCHNDKFIDGSPITQICWGPKVGCP
jgi:hypothetical protein